MDDRIKAFLEELEQKLEGIPEAEAKGALEYYEEYLNDALDEGKSVDELLEQMDSPEKISAIIKTEASIRKVQSSPDLKNYSKVLKYAFSSITAPVSILLFSVFIFITYGIALMLFCGAIAAAIAAVAIFVGLLYEAVKIPLNFIPEIIGTAGIGLFGAGTCLLTAYGLFLSCRIFIRLSSGLVGRMLNKSLRATPETQGEQLNKGKSRKKLVRVCIVAALAGLTIATASGMPVKMFRIFNSMEPSSITTKVWEYDKTAVKGIVIDTEHSHIRVEKSASDKIIVKYEQPDWLKSEAEFIDGQIIFTEKSIGRLPLFQLVSMHENRTDVVVELPEGMNLDSFGLETRGGFVYVENIEYDVIVKTYSGSIFLAAGGSDKPYNVKATTNTGLLMEDGKSVGTKASGVISYEKGSGAGIKIVLDTERGSIFID